MPYFKNISFNEAMEYDYITLHELITAREAYLSDKTNSTNEAAVEIEDTLTEEMMM